MKTIVTKQEFAQRKGRAPSAISNWIAAGKISKAALVGDGVRARIWVEQAEADLAVSLDPAQQAAQDVPATLPTTPTAPEASLQPRLTSTDDEDLRRRRKADADRAEHEAEQARRRLAIDEGRYILADEAARTWGRELARLMSDIETFLFSTLARKIADRHGIDWKELAVQMRESFREFRAGVSDDARKRREAIETEAQDAD